MDDHDEVVCILKKYWKERVANTWDYADVQWQTGLIFPGMMLSDEDVKVVLDEMLNDHNAEVGITWGYDLCSRPGAYGLSY